MAELQSLKNKRKVIRHSITRFEKVLGKYSEEGNVEVLKIKYEEFQKVLANYNEIQDEISMLSEVGEEEEEERLEEEDKICRLLVEARKLLFGVAEGSEGGSVQQASIRLPTINLPKFDGDYTEWATFYTTFQSLIHNNSGLDPVQKLHYLRSCLGEEPLRVIESLPITQENYGPAWRLLIERYENKRIIVQHHIKNLFALPDNASDKTKLRLLLDKTNVHVEALKVLGIEVDKWDPILVYIITQKFGREIKKEWENLLTNNEIPSMDKLKEFIKQKCQVLESCEFKIGNTEKPEEERTKQKSEYSQKLNKKINCPKCKKDHWLFQCPLFQALTEKERYDDARKLKVCINCLKDGHDRLTCKSTNCKVCMGAHHTLLHFNKKEPKQTNAHSSNGKLNVLLSTAIILVKDSHGVYHKARALLDVGSQQNFITEKLSKQLGLNKKKITTTIVGIGGNGLDSTYQTTIEFKAKTENYVRKIDCIIIQKITEAQPFNTFDASSLNIPQTIVLADPEFHVSNDIDVLIGAGLFYELLRDGRLKISNNQTYLQNSVLGWLVGGPYFAAVTDKVVTQVSNLSTYDSLEKQLIKQWEIENLEYPSELSESDQHCETMFRETTTRDSNGRFIVRLPFKNIPNKIGSTKEIALSRLKLLETKFKKSEKLREEYNKFLKEYLSLGHMEKVTETENVTHAVYLPHHPIIKSTSITTKTRVVFDASARSTNGLSLNDILLPGPNLQNDLFLLLTECRFYRYTMSADIKKMYRQILIHPEDRDYLRILYRHHLKDKITTYRLKTVPYGLNCAPFLAMRCLRELAEQSQKDKPEISKIIKNNFYMDDLLVGINSVEKGIKLRDDLIYALNQGGFELYKWASNCKDILPTNKETQGPHIIRVDANSETKILGLIWNCETDTFKYQSFAVEPFDKITKREALAIIAKIFDPLGLLSPIIVHGKILMQEMWSLKLGWDDLLPEGITSGFKKFYNTLLETDKITVPRFILYPENKQFFEIHGFCDASKKTYGAVIYVRAISKEGEIKVNLLCAKSRVAPLKVLSIPRLELCSALLLAKLYAKIKSITTIPTSDCLFWSDSKVALAWITGDSNRWPSFVAHRVRQIQDLSDTHKWRYVPTDLNPADFITRGTCGSDFSKLNSWFHGPLFLLDVASKWPMNDLVQEMDIAEKQVTGISTTYTGKSTEILNIFYRSSKYIKLKRTFAYCLRFMHNCKQTMNKRYGPLSVEELNSADIKIFKLIQETAFHREIQDLRTKNSITFSSSLIPLNVFLDSSGLLRVGGRLRNSSLNFETKHQILLPKNHPVSILIIRDIHNKILHGGVQATIAAVRLSFWPLSLKSSVKKIIRECVRCRRVRPIKYEELMGDLPMERVTPARPFQNSGIDYAGPFNITERKGRGKHTFKSYVAVFVCFSTKAVHLELVLDYTSEAFLNALKRVMARRGKILQLWSDNGTNFVGANRELRKIKEMFNSDSFQSGVMDPLTNEGIKWKFIPPNSPYVGGLWESAVKAFKRHMKAIWGGGPLTIEEMYTLLAQVEAILNSRPLTPLSDDPNDLEALTPGHFLIGATIRALPEPSILQTSDNRLSRWQRLEKLRQHFWKRWSNEYLQELQKRSKWRRPNGGIQEGTLVLLREENTPPLKWHMARVTKLHPGADGIARVVTLKTSTGETTRAVGRLCPLID